MGKVFVVVCAYFCVALVNCQFGFYQPRDDRRYGSQSRYNFLGDTRRLSGIFQVRPGNMYNFNRRPANNQRPDYNQDSYNPNFGQYEPNNQYNPYGQNNYYNQNGGVAFPRPNPSQVNYDNNYPPRQDEVNFGGESTGNDGNNDYNNGIPNVSGAGIPNVEPSGGGIPNTPPSGIGFPNVPPSSAGIPNVPPAGINFPNAPTSGAGIPSVPPTGFGISSGAGVIPDQPPVNFNDRASELPQLTPVPDFEKRNNFNFGSAGLFQETCTTIDQGVGSCISLLSCPTYVRIVQESRTNPNAVNILRKAHCGFEGNTPKVCCPRPGIPSEVPTTTTTTTTPAPAPPPAPKLDAVDFVGELPDPPICGVSNASFSRVVGGVKAKLGDFPWMALLGYKNRRGPGARWLCGGSLITSRHVLTAAHCIHGHEDDLFIVRLGELDLEKEDEGATPVDVPIKAKIKHEQYSATGFTSDIGILVLDREVTFTDLIKPICIPKDSQLRATTFEDYNPIIAGWGDTEFRGPSASHLQALQLPVVSNDFCKQAYTAYKKQTIDERVLCAGYKKGGKDACQGDSGGPLMQPIWNSVDYTTHFYQIGVVSFGKKCAEPGFPGVYSRVTHFVPWIEEKTLGAASR